MHWESKTFLESGFYAMDFAFQVLDSGILCQWNLDYGFESSVGFRIPKPKISRVTE